MWDIIVLIGCILRVLLWFKGIGAAVSEEVSVPHAASCSISKSKEERNLEHRGHETRVRDET